MLQTTPNVTYTNTEENLRHFLLKLGFVSKGLDKTLKRIVYLILLGCKYVF